MGKTAIVEGLAHFVANYPEYRDILPPSFRKKTIINLDLPSMLAGIVSRDVADMVEI